MKFPWLDDQVESHWATLAMPGAGPDYGLVWIPQVGDSVIVAFEHGDIQYPVVLGGMWNGKDAAPLGKDPFDAGKVKRSKIVSRKGHRLTFLEADDKSGIALLGSNDKYKSNSTRRGRAPHRLEGQARDRGRSSRSRSIRGQDRGGGQMKIKGATVALN